MTDGELTDPLRRWLADDLFVLNALFLVAATLLALALTSYLWHYIHPETPHNAPSIFFAALSPFRTSTTRVVPSMSQQQSLIPDQSRKSTRSKERRRRGKDPFKDLLKGGKRSKALLKSIKATDHDQLPPSPDAPTALTVPVDDIASCTSRSQSPEPATDSDHPAICLAVESDNGGVGNTTSNGTTSSTPTAISSSDMSGRGPSDACSQADPSHSFPIPLDPTTSLDVQADVSSASTVMGHATKGNPSFPPVSTACATICALPPRNCSHAASVSGNCAKLVRARTRLRLSRIETSVKSLIPSTSSALPDGAVTSSSSHSNVPRLSLSAISSTHLSDGAGPSTPTNSRGSTPPPRSPSEDPNQEEPNIQPPNASETSARTQLASMHGALEAARLREEQLRREAEQASKERDELHWRWNENAGFWRRREAELQAQIYHLSQQLQAYVAVASLQAQQISSSSFSSPTSPRAHSSPLLQHHPVVPLPPAIQAQNSASAPAHVQALLASAPMLTSHPPGFAAPAPAGLHSGTDFSRSPLLWSGLGSCALNRDPRHRGRQTPDSSASGSSSSRRRRRRAENIQSASDESSLGEWDGVEDGSGDEDLWEEEEDIFRNNALADAILKRPESIREISVGIGKRLRLGRGRPLVHGTSEVGRGGVEKMDILEDPALEKHDCTPSSAIDTPAIKTVADAVDRQ